MRMLGKGRPFVIEVISPKMHFSIGEEQLKEIAAKVNESEQIQISGLTKAEEKESMDYLKNSESQKIKAYGCLCHSAKPLDQKHMDYLSSMEQFQVILFAFFHLFQRNRFTKRPHCAFSTEGL